ncbi:hypothetical protein DV495_001621 [Geotrichum candidum]|uniref:Uncharacterized protein n=1 Tax=Geotrichum candidum TaxID=1173061 RepID=A0A0J9XDN1_GEOCN|nr:hypothetical protein DV452_005036 [Geotrichum candidum]KAI9213808.1 hypothetical protein DS838_001329 [Geotrichum bryndzae]KAF5132119.1 hypothetical protein DV495_001621 [Geotrichum candidum]KAF7500678.1 hypothetical protein DV113_001296 [Geotrichum candidum]KAI8131830.1 hypothetical protein DUD61_004507 [Geotrichum candidum]
MPRPRLRRQRAEAQPITPSKPSAESATRTTAAALKAKATSTPATAVLFDTANILAELTPPAASQKGTTSFTNRLASSPPPLNPPSSPPVIDIDTQEIDDGTDDVVETRISDQEPAEADAAAKESAVLPSVLPATDEDPFGFASADTVLAPTAFKKPTFSTAEAAELLSSPRKRRRFQARHHNDRRRVRDAPADFSYLDAFSDISSPARPASTVQDENNEEEEDEAAAAITVVRSDAVVISSDAPDREAAPLPAPSLDELIRILPPRRHHSDSEDLPLSSSPPLSPGGRGGASSDDEYDAEERARRRKRRRQRQRAAERREEQDSAVAAQRAEEKRRRDEARAQKLRDKFKEIDQWQLMEETVPADTSSMVEESTPGAAEDESQG